MLRISSMTFLRRSSNSPRYFVPATSEPMSSVSRRLFGSVSGTSPATMRCARPSAIAVLPTPGSPMSTGLFFVRRERIWMTRSISFSRPMTGSSLPARAASVRLMPSWSTVGVLLARFARRRRAGGRALREDADDLVADLVEVDAEDSEHARGDALALADEAEEQVLRADVVVVEPARLVDGQLDDLLGARRQADLADDRPVAAADDELDGGAHLVQLDAQVLEHPRRDAIALADEAEQQVLGADVVVVEPLRLVLGEGQDPACALRELVETIHRVERLFPSERRGRGAPAMLARRSGTARRDRRVRCAYPYERRRRPWRMHRDGVRNRNDPPVAGGSSEAGRPAVSPPCSPPSSFGRSP